MCGNRAINSDGVKLCDVLVRVGGRAGALKIHFLLCLVHCVVARSEIFLDPLGLLQIFFKNHCKPEETEHFGVNNMCMLPLATKIDPLVYAVLMIS